MATHSTGLSLLARSGESGWSAAAVNARGDPASRIASSVVQRPLSTEPKDRIGWKTDMGRCLKQMPHHSRMHLLERATHDQSPLLAMGVGRSDASDGRVFPYVFTAPTTHRSQNTAQTRFIGQRTGGMDKLKGLKIVHVYLDNDYGRETLPILDAQAAQYGFTVQHLAGKPPGLDQQVTWLRVKVAQPDWVILRTTGVMATTALKEAAQAGCPRDTIVGASPTCTEQEVVPAGEAAMGFICAPWHGTGTHLPLIQEVLQYVYARGKGAGPERDVGTGAGHAARPAHHGGAAYGHAPFRPPAPDGRAGTVGARTPQPHASLSQGAGGRGPDATDHPRVPRS